MKRYTLNMTGWECMTYGGSCVGMPAKPTQLAINKWQVSIPSNLAGKIGYLRCPHNTKITQSKLVGTFEVFGSGTFVDMKEPFGDICTARFLIMKDFSTNSGRLWSNPVHINLQSMLNGGSIYLETPLDRSQWTNVIGQYPTDIEWQSMMNAPTHIGFTFGAVDFGHGVAIKDGAATFTATDIKLL